ncbi:MAG: ribbon-helix-helix protein, CopG family [Enterococcus sp.]|nr:ribbon-helix-helix protein, CopG family [Enterococcus sp.]
MAKKQIGITLDEKSLELLEKQAKQLGLTKSQYIALLLNQKNEEGKA